MKRSAVVIAVAVVSLAASLARADAVPPPICSESCQGCCQGTTCLPSTAANCGVGGAVCVVCQSGQLCSAGVCKTDTDGGPKPADGAVTPPKETDSGCAVGGRDLARVVGPWLLCASFFALLLLAGRRRRR